MLLYAIMALEIRSFSDEDKGHIKHKKESKYKDYADQVFNQLSLSTTDKVIITPPNGVKGQVFQIGLRSQLAKLGLAVSISIGTDDRNNKEVLVVTKLTTEE